MRRRLTCLLGALACLAWLPAAHADLPGDLENFFNNINLGNVTAPGVYQGQSAGYYTGGSLFLRVPQRSYDLVNVQWPRFRAGCGGIDLFAGGFSFINADALVNMLRNIGSAAVSHAFLLALRVVSPQIASTIEQLQDWAQRYNLGQINSCEAGRDLVGAAARHLGSQQFACTLARVEQDGETWAEARAACTSGGARAATLNRIQATPALDNLLLEGNVAWRALMRNRFFAGDLELARAVMTLTGTVIVRRSSPTAEDSPLQWQVIPGLSAGGVERMLNALIEGTATAGTPSLLRCEGGASPRERGCDRIAATREPLNVTAAEALRTRVQALLERIQQRILLDQPMTLPGDAEELAFLESVTLPVYKYLTVSASFQFSGGDFDVTRFSRLIAKDLLVTYLRELLAQVAAGAATLQAKGEQAPQLREFLQQLRATFTSVRRISARSDRQFSETLRLNEEVRLAERLLLSLIDPLARRSALWQVSSDR